MANQPLKDVFTPEGKAELTRIVQLLQEADKAFKKLNDVENAASLDIHKEGYSLNHCIRWGLQSAEDLNEAVGNPEPPELVDSETEVQLGVLALNEFGAVYETFTDERARSLWCAEQDATIDTFFYLDVQGQVKDYGIAATGKDALEDLEEDELDVYVVVTGEATESEDESVPGAYLVQVSLKKAVVIENLTDEQQSTIATAVLDKFHRSRVIGMLEDFGIEVHLSNGEMIEEDPDISKPSKIVLEADYCGQVNLADVPFEFEGKAELLEAETSNSEFDNRVEALPLLKQQAGAAYTLYQVASKAIQDAGDDVDWGRVHQDVFAKAVGQDQQPVARVLEVIKEHSPGAVTPEQIAAVNAIGESMKVTTSNAIAVTFESRWEEGVISTDAKLDLETGIVFDITESDAGAGYEHLIGEFVHVGDREVAVELEPDNHYRIDAPTLAAIRAEVKSIAGDRNKTSGPSGP